MQNSANKVEIFYYKPVIRLFFRVLVSLRGDLYIFSGFQKSSLLLQSPVVNVLTDQFNE
jgi:hypothetical protein